MAQGGWSVHLGKKATGRVASPEDPRVLSDPSAARKAWESDGLCAKGTRSFPKRRHQNQLSKEVPPLAPSLPGHSPTHWLCSRGVGLAAAGDHRPRAPRLSYPWHRVSGAGPMSAPLGPHWPFPRGRDGDETVGVWGRQLNLTTPLSPSLGPAAFRETP